MTVRAGDAGDARPVSALHLRTVLFAYASIFPPEAPRPTLSGLERDWTWRLAAEHVFVAEDEGEVVGVVVAGPDPDDYDRGHLSRLYVAPERWGGGIGSALYERAVEHLQGRGFDVATLWVLEANLRTRGWYERRGWQLTGRRKPAYEPGAIDDVGYELKLRR